MDWLSFILSLLTILLGGLNIFQLLTFRAYKRQRNAEADKSEIENLKTVIETIQSSTQKEIERLQKRVEEAESRATENANRYFALYDKYDNLRSEFETYKLTHK